MGGWGGWVIAGGWCEDGWKSGGVGGSGTDGWVGREQMGREVGGDETVAS